MRQPHGADKLSPAEPSAIELIVATLPNVGPRERDLPTCERLLTIDSCAPVTLCGIPSPGRRRWLIESAEETGGARIVAEFAVDEGGFVPGGEHSHDNSSEHFEALSGLITFLINGEERTLGPGEQFTVPPGAWHRWWNAGEGEVRTRVRFDPALRFEEATLFCGACARMVTRTPRGCPRPCSARSWPPVTETKCVCASHPRSRSESCCPRWPHSLGCLGKERTIERYLSLDSHPSAQASLGQLPERVMRRTR